ncbi:hypothetical protein GGI04_000181 [Coemansia thaxteri]|nr:hypothetical protein GGI04_000181 [Coemansia thaxteri]KAJ2474408.1 hypothetical protein GGI02_000118 [Coemansia sp. RSA 2322]
MEIMSAQLEEVSNILKHRFGGGSTACEYLVQWTSDASKTWEPSDNLTECSELLCEYWRAFSTASGRFEFLVPSCTVLSAAPVSEAEEDIEVSPEPSAPKRRRNAGKAAAAPKRTGRVPKAEDKIAVAKRVQMNRQLSGALSRAGSSSRRGALAQGSHVSSTPVGAPRRPPSATARRSIGSDLGPGNAPPAPAAASQVRSPRAQVARKSTGGYRLPPRPAPSS